MYNVCVEKLQLSKSVVTFLLFTTACFVFAAEKEGRINSINSKCGSVLDEQGVPIPGASVRIQATEVATTTDLAGRFCLSSDHAELAITAWKEGFYIGGLNLADVIKSEITIELRSLPENQTEYRWLHSHAAATNAASTRSGTEPCGQCHERLTNEWLSSSHGQSNKNPLFEHVLSLAERDFSNSGQQCRLCHQPQHETKPIGCDFCHKISNVFGIGSQRSGKERIEHLLSEEPPVFFGPLDDVFSRHDSFNILYTKSEYCAACHQGNFWSTQAYSVYDEWQESRFQREQIQCQDCHMAPTANFAANKSAGGIRRLSSSLSSHDFLLKGKADLLSSAIDMEVRLNSQNGLLDVVVELSNNNAGHHVPTGSPLRNMLLLVTAEDKNGELPMSAGSTVPKWAGNTWQGHAGKGFGKILTEIPNYREEQEQHFEPIYPAPFWRPTIVESDSRIAAGTTDRSVYSFASGDSESFRVSVRVLYFEYFADWLLSPPPEPVELATYKFIGEIEP